MKRTFLILLSALICASALFACKPNGEQSASGTPKPETPSEAPTEAPTEVPTEAPTEVPTAVPTEAPTEEPLGEADALIRSLLPEWAEFEPGVTQYRVEDLKRESFDAFLDDCAEKGFEVLNYQGEHFYARRDDCWISAIYLNAADNVPKPAGRLGFILPAQGGRYDEEQAVKLMKYSFPEGKIMDAVDRSPEGLHELGMDLYMALIDLGRKSYRTEYYLIGGFEVTRFGEFENLTVGDLDDDGISEILVQEWGYFSSRYSTRINVLRADENGKAQRVVRGTVFYGWPSISFVSKEGKLYARYARFIPTDDSGGGYVDNDDITDFRMRLENGLLVVDDPENVIEFEYRDGLYGLT